MGLGSVPKPKNIPALVITLWNGGVKAHGSIHRGPLKRVGYFTFI